MNTASGSLPTSQDNVLLIGKGFTIEGHVRGQGTLLVGGHIKGDVTADIVRLTETAHVSGHVACAQLDVAGRLDGSFQTVDMVVRAGGAVTLQSEGVSQGTGLVAGLVAGPLKANQLKVDSTGQLEGHTVASQMDVHGQVRGQVDVGDMVVRSRGVVDGQLTYANLAMEHGSDVTGQLQRKQRAAAPAATLAAGRPALAPARPAADGVVFLQLPDTIVKRLREQPADFSSSLVNGEPLPDWISLDPANARLVLVKSEFDRLAASGDSLTVRLQAGGENLIFKLPPSAP